MTQQGMAYSFSVSPSLCETDSPDTGEVALAPEGAKGVSTPFSTVCYSLSSLSAGLLHSLKDGTFGYGPDGKLVKVAPELWSITDETGAAVTELTDGALYELRVTVADGGDFDLSETEKEIKLSVVLGK